LEHRIHTRIEFPFANLYRASAICAVAKSLAYFSFTTILSIVNSCRSNRDLL
jgi:hypothetical protein